MPNRTAKRYAKQAQQREVERDELQREVNRLTENGAEWQNAEIEGLKLKLAEAVANNQRTMCSYCGEVRSTAGKTLDQVTDEMVEHIAVCPTHPFAKAEAAIGRLESVLREIDSLCAERDEDGPVKPKEPLSWETVALMALDLAHHALNPPPAPDPVPALASEVSPREGK